VEPLRRSPRTPASKCIPLAQLASTLAAHLLPSHFDPDGHSTPPNALPVSGRSGLFISGFDGPQPAATSAAIPTIPAIRMTWKTTRSIAGHARFSGGDAAGTRRGMRRPCCRMAVWRCRWHRLLGFAGGKALPEPTPGRGTPFVALESHTHRFQSRDDRTPQIHSRESIPPRVTAPRVLVLRARARRYWLAALGVGGPCAKAR